MKKPKQILSVFLAVIMLLSSIPLMGLDGIFSMKADATTMKQTIASMSVGDKFTFGSYPQSDVTASLGTTLTARAPATSSWNSYNYYISKVQSDYMKYYDLAYNGERYRGVYFTSYRPYRWDYSSSSTYQDDNGYNTNTIYWFKYEPLTWRVLDPATGYVICETIIDSQAFNNERYANGSDENGTAYYNDTTYQHLANNWEYSTIRQWLNSTFYTTAFTSSERSQIPATVHTTPAYSTSYSEYDVGETTDYIFLPTYQDMLNTSYGFSSSTSSDMNRRAHASAYAKAQGAYVSTSYTDSYGEYTSYYRLRSAGYRSYSTTNVDDYGYVYYYWHTDSTYIGIRPALCFNPLSTGTPTTCTHTWDDGEITTPANCVDTGTKTLTCTGCGETKQETISVNSNNHKSVVTLNAVAATCTATGLTEGSKCTACNKILIAQNVVNTIDHKYTILVETVPATSSEPGYSVMKCENCDATTNVPLMAKIVSEMSVGDKFTFGSYPQSDVTATLGAELTAAAPVTSSWNSYNYYISKVQSDYMKYYDLTYNGERYRGVYFTSYRPNSWDYSSSSTYQDDNGYNTNTIYWFKYEPLTWRVLDPATGYVMCETIIDSQAFNNERYANGSDENGTAYYNDTTYQHLANNWEYSTIRQWLNNTFYTTAFTSSERSQIPATVHTTPAYSTSYSEYDVGETTDYIFLPTYQDMRNTEYGFSSSSNRMAHASAYAKAQGAYVSTSYTDSYGEYTSWYRLRSAGSDSYYTANVSGSGDVYNIYDTYTTRIGIRPALCFNPLSTGTPTTCTHTWDAGEITTPANCVETGTMTFTCTECGDTKDETIEKLPHKYTVYIKTVPATDNESGYIVMKCKTCEETKNIPLEASIGGTISKMHSGEFFPFGSYPQTDVTDSLGTTLTAAAPAIVSWNSYNYYLNGSQSDYMKYYDLTFNGERYRGVYFTSYRPMYWNYSSSAGNTYQDNNGYNTNTIYWFKYEPLIWRVLDPATGYVLCETIIDSQAYNNITTTQHYANNWEYSTIRQWLNETFYNTAFSESERSQISVTRHTTPAFSTEYSEYDVGETTDYIFLPSYQDMNNTEYGFSSDSDRMVHSTDYAKAQGVYVDTNYKDKDEKYTSYYRLRSAGNNSNISAEIDYIGNFNYFYTNEITFDGIRPAMCFCEHAWNDGEITSEPNCVDTGIKTITCTKCGATKTETVPVNSNNHKEVVTLAAVEATCTATGLTEGRKCTACDTVLTSQVETKKLSHIFNEKIVDSAHLKTAATCKAKAVFYYDCSRCAEISKVDTFSDGEFDLTNHSTTETVLKGVVAETCIEKGFTGNLHCKACDKIVTPGTEIPAKGHDIENHTAKKPTCTEIGWDAYETCLRPGCTYKTYVEKAKLGHDFTEQAVDSTHLKTEATCTAKAVYYYDCSRCDEISKVDTFETGEFNPNNHAKSETTLKNAVNATCTNDGYTGDYHCNACNAIVTSGKATTKLGHDIENHTAKEPTCTEIGWDAYETCLRPGCTYKTYVEKAKLGHEFTEKIVDFAHLKTQATCTEKAVYYYDCSRCAEISKVDTFEHGDVLDHDYTEKIINKEHLKTEATCTEKAVYYYDCSRCEKISTEDTFEHGDALGHSFTNYESNNDATCTEDGTETAKCDRCDATDTKPKAALGHSFTNYVSNNDATCTEDGTETATCDRCDATDTKLKAALGHSFTNYVSNNDATCTEDGTETATCDRCDATDTKTDVKSAKGHTEAIDTAVAATCTLTGLTEGKHCSVCNEVLTAQEEIDALGHKEVTNYENIDATCKVPGSFYAVTKCSVCHEELDREIITGQLLPHDFTQKIIDEAHLKSVATCTTKAVYFYDCVNCDTISRDKTFETGEFDFTNHSTTATNLKDEVAATCTEEGFTGNLHCVACDSIVTPGSVITKLDHKFTEEVIDSAHLKTAATCTTKAVYYYDCSRCEEISTEETFEHGDALGHSFTNYESNNDATCTEKGTQTAICDRCDATDTKPKSALGHSFTNYAIIKNATCTEDGTQTAKCDRCEVSFAIIIPALGHSFTNYVSNNDAKCLTDGTETAKCDRCNETHTRPIVGSAPGYHTWNSGEITKNSNCVDIGTKFFKCTVCNATKTEPVPINSSNHKSKTYHEGTEPDCTEKGYTAGEYCSSCHKWISGHDIIKALGHNHKCVDTVKSTCKTYGYEIYVCDRCGDFYTKTLPLRHVDDDNDGFCDYCLIPIPTTLDLVFVVDSTNSMREDFNDVKMLIQDYANQLAQGTIPFNISLIDFSNDSRNNGLFNYYNINFNLTDDIHEISTGISSLSIKYGSDEPVYSALINGLDELHWSDNSTKRVILIGDESPMIEPASTTGYDYDDAVNSLLQRKVVLDAIAIGGTDIDEYRNLATATNGRYSRTATMNDFAQELNDILDDMEDIHVHSYELTYCDATCTVAGTVTYYCAGCETEISTEAPLGHNYSIEWTVDIQPSCTEYGSKSHHCTRCSAKTDVTPINKLSHNLEHYVVASTCKVQGEEYDICYNCRRTFNYSVLPLASHTWSDYCQTIAPNCTNTGSETRTCSVCTTTEQREVPKLGHNLGIYTQTKAPTCIALGSEKRTCSRCTYYEEREIPELGHSISEWTITKTPTCIDKGSEKRTCSRCTYSEKREIPELGHMWNVGEITTSPTCIEQGIKTFTCTVCSHTHTESITATGHIDTNNDDICDNCGENLSDRIEDCKHLCHKKGFLGFIWKIVRFFWKLFRVNPTCECGAAHY